MLGLRLWVSAISTTLRPRQLQEDGEFLLGDAATGSPPPANCASARAARDRRVDVALAARATR